MWRTGGWRRCRPAGWGGPTKWPPPSPSSVRRRRRTSTEAPWPSMARWVDERRPTMNANQILEQGRSALAQIKVPGAEDAGMETTWADLDVGSLALVEIVHILEALYGSQIVDEK